MVKRLQSATMVSSVVNKHISFRALRTYKTLNESIINVSKVCVFKRAKWMLRDRHFFVSDSSSIDGLQCAKGNKNMFCCYITDRNSKRQSINPKWNRSDYIFRIVFLILFLLFYFIFPITFRSVPFVRFEGDSNSLIKNCLQFRNEWIEVNECILLIKDHTYYLAQRTRISYAHTTGTPIIIIIIISKEKT